MTILLQLRLRVSPGNAKVTLKQNCHLDRSEVADQEAIEAVKSYADEHAPRNQLKKL
jgi:hypothetical protein